MNSIKEKHRTVEKKIQKDLGYKNIFQTPKVIKVVLNVGLGSGIKDGAYVDVVENTLRRITGQQPIKQKAKKSISNFKIREGQIVGIKVTLRGEKMYSFIEKLIHATFPRVRDFRGLSTKIVDEGGSLNIGFKEHIAFPEIKSDEVERIHGLQVTVVSSAKNKKEGLTLFKELGFPFIKS